MATAESTPGFSVRIEWQPTWIALPGPMQTVLVAFTDAQEPLAGYWDGERWYSCEGDRLAQVAWWAEMPQAPPPLTTPRRRLQASRAEAPARPAAPRRPALKLVVSR